MQNDIAKRLIILLITLFIAAGTSIAGGYGGAKYAGFSVFFLCFIWAFILNWLAFIPASFMQTEKFYDLVGGLTFISIILLAVLLTPELTLRAKLAATMVIVWAIRLFSFLFIRIMQDGGDKRFDEVKSIASRFFITWSIQALWAVVTSACALAIIVGENDQSIGVVGVVGISLWLIGLIVEVIADFQKRTFRRNPNNKETYIKTGLWAWSRHPNYFGELLLWFGISLLAVPVLSGWQWFALISPVYLFLMLTKVTGIPLLEQQANKLWGDDPDYQSYVANTPVLIPTPPKT